MDKEGVEIELRVGTLDFALAKLISDQYHVIEFPTLLLPRDVTTGSIVRLQCKTASTAEKEDKANFESVQQNILDAFTTDLPQTPALRARNVTQTSVVLEWDPIVAGTADLLQLDLFKDDQRIGSIPDPLKRTATKVSNLNFDSPYKFKLVLSTSAGKFESNLLDVQTHKVSDLTGVVVCIGSLNDSNLSEQEIKDTLEKLNCKPSQQKVSIDTTHYICTTEGGPDFEKACNLNVPVVRPEWIKACESERRLVSVKEYYLSENLPSQIPAQKPDVKPVDRRVRVLDPNTSETERTRPDVPGEGENEEAKDESEHAEETAAQASLEESQVQDEDVNDKENKESENEPESVDETQTPTTETPTTEIQEAETKEQETKEPETEEPVNKESESEQHEPEPESQSQQPEPIESSEPESNADEPHSEGTTDSTSPDSNNTTSEPAIEDTPNPEASDSEESDAAQAYTQLSTDDA